MTAVCAFLNFDQRSSLLLLGVMNTDLSYHSKCLEQATECSAVNGRSIMTPLPRLMEHGGRAGGESLRVGRSVLIAFLWT